MNKLILLFTIVILVLKIESVVGTPAPTNIWGIYGHFNENFNISNFDIVSGEITNYPVILTYGYPLSILSVTSYSALMVFGDEVSMSIIELDYVNNIYTIFQTIEYNSSNLLIVPNTFAYNPSTEILFAAGYSLGKDENITIYGWDFKNQYFSNYGIEGEDINTNQQAASVYNPNSTIFYVNIFDTKYNADMIYAFNTSNTNTDQNIFYIMDNVSEFQIEFLVMTDNGTIYGVSADDDNYVMIYTMDYKTGLVTLFYHLKSPLIETAIPVVAYNEYLLIFTNSGQQNENTVTILNTLNRQSKTYPIGINGVLPKDGSFYVATVQ